MANITYYALPAEGDLVAAVAFSFSDWRSRARETRPQVQLCQSGSEAAPADGGRQGPPAASQRHAARPPRQERQRLRWAAGIKSCRRRRSGPRRRAKICARAAGAPTITPRRSARSSPSPARSKNGKWRAQIRRHHHVEPDFEHQRLHQRRRHFDAGARLQRRHPRRQRLVVRSRHQVHREAQAFWGSSIAKLYRSVLAHASKRGK